jgi:hypothetical protein
MSHVPLLETERGPLQVKTVYEEFHRRYANIIADATAMDPDEMFNSI